jgi:SNF2 family DNA or RNA helicase
LEDLQRLVRPLVLHRRKQDCLDLPPKLRQLWPVELDEPSARGFQHRLQVKVDDYRRRAALGEVRRDAELLAVLTALRQIGSDYKLPATRALVAPLLAKGEAVVVFTAFVATAEMLHRSFEASCVLTGALPPAQRQAQVDAFQRGDHSLLIATYGTGGLGFTLHRARHVVLIAPLDSRGCGTGRRSLSPHWHGGLPHQLLAAAGRCRPVGGRLAGQ